MELIQLQTQPICPKCKKGHSMRVSHFNLHTQEVFYETDCRVRPIAFSVEEMRTENPENESFYFNNQGWITYISIHGNYAYQLTMDAKENAYALTKAYEGENGIIHTPLPTEEELAALEELGIEE